MAYIRTRIIIISDTHGSSLDRQGIPLQPADVAIHCGDLTDGSKLDEYRKTLALLRDLEAPLKLVIPGNHDFSLDGPALQAKVNDAEQELPKELVEREYGSPQIIQKLFDDERATGIFLLKEGTHTFTLQNGAQLKVYASPYTPSLGAWGFQYHPDHGHAFDVEPDTHIAITHAPPKGVLDYTYGRERAGCPYLFAAVAKAKPLLHCFGHIHEGWGAKLVRWKGSGTGSEPTHMTAIDNEDSVPIEKLADLRQGPFDDDERRVHKANRLAELERQKCAIISDHLSDVPHSRPSKHTLFVNASIESSETFPQRPWLVDIDLPE